ncbi:MAG: DinB family protein [Pseudomonadota bacterium]
MITPDYIQLMARYSAWQNSSLMETCGQVAPDALHADQGLFFGSIFATLNHLLWGDRIWMHRFAGTPQPRQASITDSVQETPDWAHFMVERMACDQAIQGWAAQITPERLAGELTWHSASVGRDITKPMAFLVVHFFNHQTHHRGQVHGALTSLGAKPGATDVFLIP